MGYNVDATLCFGVFCGKQDGLPWGGEGNEYDIELWWRAVNGYQPALEPYTADGGYAPGWSRDDPRLDEYFQHREDWMAKHPLPVEEVRGGTWGETDIILVVPGIDRVSGDWCKPESVELSSLDVPSEAAETLIDFCRKYDVPIQGKPGWWLVAFYG